MPKPKTRPMRNLIFWISAGIVLLLLWNVLQSPTAARKEVTFSQFMTEVEQGTVEKVTIQENQINGVTKDNQAFKTTLPAGYAD